MFRSVACCLRCTTHGTMLGRVILFPESSLEQTTYLDIYYITILFNIIFTISHLTPPFMSSFLDACHTFVQLSLSTSAAVFPVPLLTP